MSTTDPGAQPDAPAIEICGLEFAYPSGFRLAIANLVVRRGEQVLLSGPSGSGKSTLLHLIAGIEHPQRGSIAIGGTNILGLAEIARDLFRGRHVGMIFQTFNLLHGFTAAENVRLALMLAGHSRNEQEQIAHETLSALGIATPDRSVDALSVGQQQRVAVARAMAGSKTLVLADEPTASLDPRNAHAAIQVIRDAAKARGAALLLSSHDPTLRGAFDRVIEIESLHATGAAR